MPPTFEQYKSLIRQRWEDSFDQLAELRQLESRVRSIKYGSGPRYQLKDYFENKMQAGGNLGNQPYAGRERIYEYGLDGLHRPVTSRVLNAEDGKIESFGYYIYQPERIEYIEFDFSQRIPSSIQVLLLDKKRKLAFLYINTVSDYWDTAFNTLPKETISKTLTDKDAIVCYIEEFIYKNDILTSSVGRNSSPGKEIVRFEDIYTYGEDGKLLSIEINFGDIKGLKYYASPVKRTFRQQSRYLSEKIADMIVEELKLVSLDSPLFYLRLVYNEVVDYLPSLLLVTEKDKARFMARKKSPFLPGDIIKDNLLYLDSEQVEKELCEFDGMMEREDNWEAGHDMLMEAAAILTRTRFHGAIPVSDNFVVAPLDETMGPETLAWSIEYSGASKSAIRDWKKAGWI